MQELRRKIYIKAKAEQQHRFWGIYVHVCKMETLQTAYQIAKANAGAPGIDGVTFEHIEREGVQNLLQQLQEELQNETYLPQRNREVLIPKANGKTRKLGIPAIRDRVVQNALKLVLEPIFEADFQEGSYGYRPKRTTEQALKKVRVAIAQNKTRVIDLDLKAYFDNIRHHLLLAKVAKRVNDGQVMHLLKLILKAGGKTGVPQGGPLSPLLSNIYLNEVDRMLEKAMNASRNEAGYPGMEYARFADDMVILVGWHYDYDKLWQKVDYRLREELANLQVEINEEKTKYVRMNKQQTFSFLGFNIRSVENRRTHKKVILCSPKIEARTKLFRNIGAVFKRFVSQPLEHFISEVNSILRGWLNYFRIGNSAKVFRLVRQWMITKVRRHLMRAKGRRGFGWKRWSTEQLIEKYKIYNDYHITNGKILTV